MKSWGLKALLTDSHRRPGCRTVCPLELLEKGKWGLDYLGARSELSDHHTFPCLWEPSFRSVPTTFTPNRKGRPVCCCAVGPALGQNQRYFVLVGLLSLNRQEKILPKAFRSNSLSLYANNFLDSLEETPKLCIHFMITDTSSREIL